MKILNKIINKLRREDEVIIIKKITYSRFYILLLLLFLIDTISSYIATQHPQIAEVNKFSAFFFSLGIYGLYLWIFIGAIFLCFITILLYSLETAFFKNNRQYFRMKLLYLIFGMYAFIFFWNLRVLIISIFF